MAILSTCKIIRRVDADLLVHRYPAAHVTLLVVYVEHAYVIHIFRHPKPVATPFNDASRRESGNCAN